MAKPDSYKCTQGESQSYKKESGSTITFIFKRTDNDGETFSHFIGAKCDNTPLTKDKQYTSKSGSVILELQNSYLETLDVGDHTLTAMFDDGKNVDVSFKMLKAETNNETSTQSSSTSNNSSGTTGSGGTGQSTTTSGTTGTGRSSPATGDTNNPMLWILLMGGSILVISGGIVVIFRKRRANHR